MGHFASTAFPDGSVYSSTLRQAIAGGTPWTPADAAEVNATDLSLLPVREIVIAAEHFVYDPDDESSSHDPGGGVLVSGDNVRRYKSTVAPAAFTSVLDLLNAQPGSPTVGDRYAIGNAPTGDDWSGNANALAVYTSVGWRFATPAIGQRVFDRDSAADIQMTEAGTWATADAAAGSIGLLELKHPLGVSVEAEQDKPPAAKVSQALGSAIGNMTANGGLAAGFDGDDDQAAASAAGRTGTDAYIGRSYPAGQRIVYGRLVPSNDEGFCSAGPSNVTVELYGKQGTAPASATDGTKLGEAGPFADQADPVFVGSDDDDSLWDHVWWRIVPDSSGEIHVAEAEVYESSTPAADTLYYVEAGAIGPWASQDTKIAESDGADGWAFYTPYEGAVVYDKTLDIPVRFNGTSWVRACGCLVWFAIKETAGSGDLTAVVGGNFYDYSVGTPPSLNDDLVFDDAAITWTAKAGVKLRLTYRARVQFQDVGDVSGTDHEQVIGVWRDSESNALVWEPLLHQLARYIIGDQVFVQKTWIITPGDQNEHTYKVGITDVKRQDEWIQALPQERVFQLEELVES